LTTTDRGTVASSTRRIDSGSWFGKAEQIALDLPDRLPLQELEAADRGILLGGVGFLVGNTPDELQTAVACLAAWIWPRRA